MYAMNEFMVENRFDSPDRAYPGGCNEQTTFEADTGNTIGGRVRVRDQKGREAGAVFPHGTPGRARQ